MSDKKIDSGRFLDIFKIVGAIAASLSGTAVLFAVIGYTIVLSFIQEMNLYGLANFPQEFFIEADIRFISDVSTFFGDHLILGLCAFLLSFSLSLLCLIYSQRKRMFIGLSLILTIAVVLITFKLGNFSENSQRFILYAVSTPFLISLIIYLGMNINQFVRPGEMVKSNYLSFAIIFLLLILSIPVSYGRHLYDLDVYSISAFEYDNEKYKNNTSIEKMRDDITKGSGELYYLMGHTAGKEIFFIPTTNPKRMVIIDREAINFIGIIRDASGKTQTLRRIMTTPITVPVEEKTRQPVLEKEKAEFEKLF